MNISGTEVLILLALVGAAFAGTSYVVKMNGKGLLDYVSAHGMQCKGPVDVHFSVLGGPFHILVQGSQIYSVPVERYGETGVLWMRTGIFSDDLVFVNPAGRERALG